MMTVRQCVSVTPPPCHRSHACDTSRSGKTVSHDVTTVHGFCVCLTADASLANHDSTQQPPSCIACWRHCQMLAVHLTHFDARFRNNSESQRRSQAWFSSTAACVCFCASGIVFGHLPGLRHCQVQKQQQIMIHSQLLSAAVQVPSCQSAKQTKCRPRMAAQCHAKHMPTTWP